MRILERVFLPVSAVCLIAFASAQILPDAPAEVMIITVPRAEIFLDQVMQGAAPSRGIYVIHNAKPGAHTLRVTMAGKHPFSQKIVVLAGKTITVRAALAGLTGDLEILTTPGAEILLDGKLAGKADNEGRLLVRGLNHSRQKVRIATDGYNPEERDIKLVAGIVSSVTIDLKPIEAVPENAPASAPDYVRQRSLAISEGSAVSHAFFQAGNARLVSFGRTPDWQWHIIQWDPGTGRLLKRIEVEAEFGISAVSPDLRWVAVEISGELNLDTAEFAESTQLREAATGRLVGEWPGTGSFTPDSKRLIVTAQYDRELFFWDLASAKKAETWRNPSIGWMLYSPDGRLVASYDGAIHFKGVSILDAETGKEVQRLQTNKRPAAFSSSGRWLATMSDSKIELWEVATGRQGRTIESSRAPDGELKFAGAVFTPDSRYLMTIMSGYAGEVRMWDTLTGREVRKWPVRWPSSMALSQDGRWLAVVANDLTVWKRVD